MDIVAIVDFVKEHWQTGVIVATASGGLFAALKNKAYGLFLNLAIDLVKQVAAEELSGPEKREKVVDSVYAILPVWAKAVVSEQQAEILAERAYQLTRGEIKAEETRFEVKNFDPTLPIVDIENLEVKSPVKFYE